MSGSKTHREVRHPQVSLRYLADYMAASETAKRSIIRDSKYRKIARVIQHEDAKRVLARGIRERQDASWFTSEAERIQNKIYDDDFDREVADHNADYIRRFAAVIHDLELPGADVAAAGSAPPITLHGVKVTIDLRARLRRTTRTNKIKLGGITLRYEKRKALSLQVAEWQSSFLHGYFTSTKPEEQAEVDPTLCLTLDVYTAKSYPAPSKAVSNFKHMMSACASIAERWPNITPPPNAVF